MTRTLHLALLLCDTPHQKVVALDGDYIPIFTNYLRRSLDIYNANCSGAEPLDFVLDPYDVVHRQDYPNLDNYDGIVMTGSAASAYQKLSWIDKLVSFMASAMKSHPRLTIIAICFGHQIIARALGGECVPNNGQWEVGVYECALNETGKEIFGKDTLLIQQMHRDHVPINTFPSSCNTIIFASTPRTPNQGFVVYRTTEPHPQQPKSIHVLALQGHPEFTARIVNTVVDVRGPEGTGVMSKEVAEDGRERAVREHDGDTAIGNAIWKALATQIV